VAAWTAGALALLLALTAWTSGAPNQGRALPAHPTLVLLAGIPGLTFDDLKDGKMAPIAALAGRGAVGALSPRTGARRPGPSDFWATVAAGDDAEGGPEAGLALPGSATFEGMDAAGALRLRGGGPVPGGGVAVLGGPTTIERNRRSHHSSLPGALGDALRAAGRRTAGSGPAALGVMDSRSTVDGPAPGPADIPADIPADVIAASSIDSMPPGALVIVFGTSQPGAAPQLLPVVVSGPGVVPGVLRSPSTNRRGVVTLPDLSATVLQAVGAKAAPGMIGRPATEKTGAWPLSRFTRMRDQARFADRAYEGFTTGFVVALAVLCALGALALSGWGPRWLPRVAVALAVALVCVPGASYLLYLLPLHAPAAVLLALVPGAIAGAGAAARPGWARPAVLVALSATLALLVADVLTSGRLQTSTVLGNSLVGGARFSGIGNATMGLLGATAVIVVASVRRRPVVLPLLALVAAVATVPWLGAKVGAVFSLVPVFALVAWCRSGRRLRWPAVAGAAALAGAVFGLVTVLDLLRPARARSHLGRLAAASSSTGSSPLAETLHRKLDTALRVMRGSHWTYAVVVVALFGGWLFIWEGRWHELAPPGSAERTAVIGVFAFAALAILTNDAGVLAAGLALSCLAPWLVVVASTKPDERGIRTGYADAAGR
jgi:hypothetical protein